MYYISYKDKKREWACAWAGKRLKEWRVRAEKQVKIKIKRIYTHRLPCSKPKIKICKSVKSYEMIFFLAFD
jgi:hypothetical protein